jgi:cytochrome P450
VSLFRKVFKFTIGFLLRIVSLKGDSWLTQPLAFIDKMISEAVAARLLSSDSKTKSTSHGRYVFLDELLTTIPDHIRIRSELLNILVAGRDTTASLLSNLLWILSRYPAIQSRLRREIIDVVGDEVPSWQQLKDMKYLRALMNESQRMYPVVPSNSREAAADTTLPRGGGEDESAPVFVPKGTWLTYHPIAMHRRKDIYGEDAEEFKPERWLDGEHEGEALRPGWGYLPFSGGPRVCIGQG